jgi:hypothetical protein
MIPLTEQYLQLTLEYNTYVINLIDVFSYVHLAID